MKSAIGLERERDAVLIKKKAGRFPVRPAKALNFTLEVKTQRKLAYTTVMTTLDRLFKKGLLDRIKSDRAFLYSPALSRADWERKRAGSLVADLEQLL